MNLRLVEQRKRWSLTWFGILVLLTIVAVIAVVSIRCVYGFLAISDPPKGDHFIVEGWLPDSALEEAIEVFQASNCKMVITTGIAMTDLVKGMQSYDTYAEYAWERMLRLGFPPELVVPVSSNEQTRDRTYYSALALRQWFEDKAVLVESLTVASKGAHSRRTRLLYRDVFGPNVTIRVVALSDRGFAPDHWWRSSQGVRSVVGEALAYFYVKFLFFPSTETLSDGTQSAP